MGTALAYVDYAQAGVIIPVVRHSGKRSSRFFSAWRRARRITGITCPIRSTDRSPMSRTRGGKMLFHSNRSHPAVYFCDGITGNPLGGTFQTRNVFNRSSDVWEFNNWIPLRVMDVPASAGFYASCWGILPYAITQHPLERFELDRVK